MSTNPTPAELIAFLNGSGKVDGVGFGGLPEEEQYYFWWRKYLPLLAPSQVPAHPADMREKVARLVDPEWFNEIDGRHVLDNFPGQHKKYQESARQKADAILSLLATPATMRGDHIGDAADLIVDQRAVEIARRHHISYEAHPTLYNAAYEAARAAFLATSAIDGREGVTLDHLDALADAWMAEASVERMANAIASVFSKWADEDIMSRFREKITALMHLAYVEGASSGTAIRALGNTGQVA